MDIKALLAKVAKGEALTEEEKTWMAGYDPDKTANSAAAAARKAAEKERDALKEKLAELETQLADAGNEGKTELEKLQKQVEKLNKALTDKDALIAKAAADQKKAARDAKIGKLLSTLELMPRVDPELARLGLERELTAIGDDEIDAVDAAHPAVSGFIAKSPGLFVGDKGGGSGTPPKDGPGGKGSPLTVDGIRKMDDAEFLKTKDSLWAQADKIKQ
jgi:hypothetical protein